MNFKITPDMLLIVAAELAVLVNAGTRSYDKGGPASSLEALAE
jgi:hypothetical protein